MESSFVIPVKSAIYSKDAIFNKKKTNLAGSCSSAGKGQRRILSLEGVPCSSISNNIPLLMRACRSLC
ncbi:hypothetical protein I7I48_01472 [Histoplasma ohiense]|nr:hypothetical protein I7I48_01472 [Histoplasma ohiense (nom. inval.)]